MNRKLKIGAEIGYGGAKYRAVQIDRRQYYVLIAGRRFGPFSIADVFDLYIDEAITVECLAFASSPQMSTPPDDLSYWLPIRYLQPEILQEPKPPIQQIRSKPIQVVADSATVGIQTTTTPAQSLHPGFSFSTAGDYSLVYDSKKVVRGIWYREHEYIRNTILNLKIVEHAEANGYTILDLDYRTAIFSDSDCIELLKWIGGNIVWFASVKNC